jgi:hypothetical protein
VVAFIGFLNYTILLPEIKLHFGIKNTTSLNFVNDYISPIGDGENYA